MKAHLQILTTPTADTPGTTMLLSFQNKKYFVGSVAEGTQRAATERGVSWRKVSDMLVTGRTEWSNVGGLVGLLLTIADAEANAAVARSQTKSKGKSGQKDEPRSYTLYGPPNLNHTLATCRRFIFRRKVPLQINEIRNSAPLKGPDGAWLPSFVDENIRVWAMAVKPTPKPNGASDNSNRPRKRSFEEFNGSDFPTAVSQINHASGGSLSGLRQIEQDAQQQDRFYQVRKGVVNDMFNSNWKLDALFEAPLSEVKLPAALWFRDPKTKKIEKYTGPLPNEEDPDMIVLVRKPWPGALVESLPPTSPATEAISYIIRCHPVRGKVLPDKLEMYGVPKGSIRGRLANGESITLDDGSIITPDMVLGPGKQGGGVAVVELPSVEYVNPLIERAEWKSQEVMDGVGGIIWILGPGVIENQGLQDFMDEHKHLKQIVSSSDCCPNRLSMDSAAAHTIRLGQVDPQRYHVPHFEDDKSHQPRGDPEPAFNEQNTDKSLPQKDPLEVNAENKASGIEDTSRRRKPMGGQLLPPHVVAAHRGQIFQLEPSIDIQDNLVEPFDIPAILAKAPPEVLRLAAKAQEDIIQDQERQEKWVEGIPSPDAEIITLGTGSALPSKYRNVSATLLRVPGHGNYLFDCGENTLGQLKRVFSPQELRDLLEDLRMIWISHLHADHHCGTVSVIKAWYEQVHGHPRSRTPPAQSILNSGNAMGETFNPGHKYLAVASESAMLNWLWEYSQVEDFGYSHIVPLGSTAADMADRIPTRLRWWPPPGTTTAFRELIPPAPQDVISPSVIGLKDLQTVNVSHCHGARGVTITLPDGLKVSYSGDCRPSKRFAECGKGSHILIHEATFDDELSGDALAKKHSTTSQALAVGAQMGAKAVVLTHFSQRYQKLPIMETIGDDEEDESSKLLDDEAENEDADVDEPVDLGDIPPKTPVKHPATSAAADPDGRVILDPLIETANVLEQEMNEETASKKAAADPMQVDQFADVKDWATESEPSNGQPQNRPEAGGQSVGFINTVDKSEKTVQDADDGMRPRDEIAVPKDRAARVKVRSKDMKVCVGFDYMRVKVKDIALMERFTPALIQLFELQEQEKEENKSENGVEQPVNKAKPKKEKPKKAKPKRHN